MVAGGRELIDTLWNVNYNLTILDKMILNYELIDTLWNVNDFYAACQYWFQGMN